jgi:hypothetical protein
MNLFHIYQGEETPQYTINLNFLVEVNREDPDAWGITTSTGTEYTLEDDDLTRFREATGI